MAKKRPALADPPTSRPVDRKSLAVWLEATIAYLHSALAVADARRGALKPGKPNSGHRALNLQFFVECYVQAHRLAVGFAKDCLYYFPIENHVTGKLSMEGLEPVFGEDLVRSEWESAKVVLTRLEQVLEVLRPTGRRGPKRKNDKFYEALADFEKVGVTDTAELAKKLNRKFANSGRKFDAAEVRRLRSDYKPGGRRSKE